LVATVLLWGMVQACAGHRAAVAPDALPKREATLEELQRVLAERATSGPYRALVTFEASRQGHGAVYAAEDV
jgi:hypothetical protein